MLVIAVFGGAALGQTLFVLLYCTLSWWRSATGRALFLSSFTLALVLDTIIVQIVLERDFPGWLYVAFFGFVAMAAWYQLITLIVVRLRAKKNEVSTVN